MIYEAYAFPMPDEKRVRVITDTDAANEGDDQFAITHTLLSPKFDNVAMVAAHFGTRNPHTMQDSYDELIRIFGKLGMDPEGVVVHGAPHALPNEETPVDSEGARTIIREAMKDDPRPLYVTFLGPLTDLASAYLLEPRIAGRLTAIWIGGGRYPAGAPEFNLGNDVNAVNVVMASGIDLWQVPKNVYEMMPVSMAELEYRVRPCGEIGRYLFDQLVACSLTEAARRSAFRTGETWVLGDSPAPGLILYEHRFEYDRIPAPRILPDMTYGPAPDPSRTIRVYRRVDSRLILEDMYCKLALFAAKTQSGKEGSK
ncbi:MAG: nucleoside hydrolase [Firmicutes bacterium]|nr:nucleoside hydrolase [Bacillota bacterium]